VIEETEYGTTEDADREALRACLDTRPSLDTAAVKAEYDRALWVLVRKRIKPRSKDVLRELNRAQVPRDQVLALKEVVEETVRKHEARVQAFVNERTNLAKKLRARSGRLRLLVYSAGPKELKQVPPNKRDKYGWGLCEKSAGIYRDIHPGVTFDVVPDGRPLNRGCWCVLANLEDELDAEIVKHGPSVTLKEWLKRLVGLGLDPRVLFPKAVKEKRG
jgi:hypothetical protein